MADWNRIRAIFEAAFDLDETERRAVVARECAGDAELRAEVEELLACSTAAERVLEEPVDASPLTHRLSAPELENTRVGAYQLGRVVASGGMGVVFEAEQQQPKRKVALKMMRLGFDSPEEARRFRYEAEVLATLRHPGIAQVFEAGVHVTGDDDGSLELPWFAMEFVEGAQTIHEFAKARALSVAERIRLFARVCAAVHHGHQRGVIHRDLKPDNILIDSAGRPKVIDFGVARSTDSDVGEMTALTRAGQIVGTLQFMSPEQVAGDRDRIDVRTDVYALGLVLFELLAEQPAYDLEGKGIHEVAQIVQHDAPRRLGAARPSLGGDLEVIVGKALEKEPDRRYASAAQLADDLERFLRHEPIAARPPSVVYQARMFARRNKIAVTATLLIVVVSVAAAIVSARAASEATAQNERATGLFDSQLDLSLAFVFDFQARLETLQGASELRRDMVEKALENLEILDREAGDDPRVRVPLARAYYQLGNVLGNPTRRNLGDRDGARRSIERAATLARRVASEHPDNEHAQFVLGEATLGLGNLAAAGGQRPEAIAFYQDAIGIFENLGADDPLRCDVVLSSAHGWIGVQLMHEKRFDAALDAMRAAAAVTARALEATGEEDLERLKGHAISAARVGGALAQSGDAEAAIPYLIQANDVQERVVALEPDNVETRSFLARGRQMLVSAFADTARFAEADRMLPGCLEDARALVEAEPEVVNLRIHLALAEHSAGDLYRKWAEASADRGGDRRPRLELAHGHYAESLRTLEQLDSESRLATGLRPLLDKTRSRLAECDAALDR